MLNGRNDGSVWATILKGLQFGPYNILRSLSIHFVSATLLYIVWAVIMTGFICELIFHLKRKKVYVEHIRSSWRS